MHLVSPVPFRFNVLVVDDEAATISARVRSAAPDADVVSCGSCDGAWSALTSGRRYSAVLAFGVDPELGDAAARRGVPVITVGQHAPLADVAAAIATVAAAVRRVDHRLALGPAPGASGAASDWARREGRLLAVCGPGGTGASSIAAALASCGASQPLPSPTASVAPALVRPAAPPSAGRRAPGVRRMRLLLADFALRGDQAFLHGLDDPAAGLLQLVDAARYRPITAADVRRHTVALRGFRLLPGLRRPAHWTAVSPTAFDECLTVLPRLFDLVVADITGDFEGEADSGSCDVEERNHVARRTACAADIVVVAGGPGANGARRLSQVVNDLLDLGVDPARIQPVVRPAGFWSCTQPKSSGPSGICGLPCAPIELPPETVRPLAAAVMERLSRLPAADRRPALMPVTPGALGCVAP